MIDNVYLVTYTPAGSPQHIKSKFGDGYALVIKVRHSTVPIKDHIKFVFTGSILEEEHRGYLHFRLPSASITSFPAIFSILEKAKQQFDLEDYELTQTSLEAIFCKFAQAQIEEEHRLHPTQHTHAEVKTQPAQPSVSIQNPLFMQELPTMHMDEDEADVLNLGQAPAPRSMDLSRDLSADDDMTLWN